jgi:3D-(3,5/4)-trihydroxycyclohexane-1,2-dione acylhydrolase (decyclizing)
MTAPAGTVTGRDGDCRVVRMTTAQALVRYLQVQFSERDGVRRRLIPAVFGIFGHGNVCGIGEALDEAGDELSFYQPKNEQAMVHTAIGFAKQCNLLSTLACSASVGPGSTNVLTGAAAATVNRVPVLLLPSDTFAGRTQGPVMQALEHATNADVTVNDCFRPISAFFDRISRPEQLLTALPQAMRVLLDQAATGAVTISLFQDVQGESFDWPVAFFESRTWKVVRRPPAEEEIAAAAQLLRDAERPLIVAGGGVHYSEAREELLRLAERFGIPVAESSAGKSAMPASQLAVGGLGHSGSAAANALARDADVIVCVGTRLIDLTTGSHSLFEHPGVRFIGINVASVDASKLGAVSVVADAKVSLRALQEALGSLGATPSAEWVSRAKDERGSWQERVDADLAVRAGERVSQGQVLRALNEQTTARDVLVVASGTPHVDVHKLWDTSTGARVHMEVGFSTMGHEIPAALGVRLADGDLDEVYAVIGDGTYLMSPSELVTAVQERLKITVIVFVNHGFQSIHALQNRTTGSSFGLEFRARTDRGLDGPVVEVDIAGNARSFGCTAFDVDTLDEFRSVLADARGMSGPVVIVVHVEPRRYTLSSDCWWDVGISTSSGREEMRRIAEQHLAARRRQRFYY